jgi:hypothetical protein
MAKKASKKRTSKKKTSKKKAAAGRGSAAVYLVKHTARGGQLAAEEQQADIDRIHDHIKKAGGTCSLFGNKANNSNEFVSIIRGLTPARHRQMVTVIERSRNIKALKMHILKG